MTRFTPVMKYQSMFAAALLSVLTACAKDNDEHRILEAAKRDSARYCSRSKDGCEFSVGKRPGGWGVLAFPITRAENADRIYIPGVFRSYLYDEHGNLVGEVPGV